MISQLEADASRTERSRPSRKRQLAMPAGLSIAALLVLGSNEACAAAFGSLPTSTGAFAALLVFLAAKGWTAHVPVGSASAAGGALLVIGSAAAWRWRARSPQIAVNRPLAPTAVPSAPQLPAAPKTQPAVPSDFECAALLAQWRLLFVQLQTAWDRCEMDALRRLTTAAMLDELCIEASTTACERNRTEVVTLHAELLAFDEFAGAYMASVAFSGLIRESDEQGAMPFRELWMLAMSKQEGESWRLARHQILF